jgi:hypothetical protein
MIEDRVLPHICYPAIAAVDTALLLVIVRYL